MELTRLGTVKETLSPSFLKQNLNYYPFSMRASTVFRKAKLETISDLVSLTQLEFKLKVGCGKVVLDEVRQWLREHGLCFSPVSIRKLSEQQKRLLTGLL